MFDASTPAIRLGLGKSVVAVQLYDRVANSEIATFHRDDGSRCTFSKTIPHKTYELVLRLDWGDLREGEPTLDLEVTRLHPDGSRSRIKPKHLPQHHTTLSALVPGSKDPRTYDLQYEGLSMRLVARKTFALGVGLSVYVVDSRNKQ